MSFDTHSLFAYSTVLLVVSQSAGTLVFKVVSGQGSLFSTGQNITIWPASPSVPLSSNAMVARITGISGDQITASYTQEGSSTITVISGMQVMNAITPKVLTDIESAINTNTSSITTINSKFPSGTIVGTTDTQTLTNKTIDFNSNTILNDIAKDGWISTSVTLTYSSTDGHTFVATTSADLSGTIQPGDRIKFTNNSTTFYGVITAINSTTITIYGGTTYSVANSAITNPYYSHAKSPFGFNTNPAIWTEQTTDTALHTISNPNTGTYYNPGSLSLTVPIGIWTVEYFVQTGGHPSGQEGGADASLSTSNNSVSDADFSSGSDFNVFVNGISYGDFYTKRKTISLSSKTPYYLIATPHANGTDLSFIGTTTSTIIRAVCAYL